SSTDDRFVVAERAIGKTNPGVEVGFVGESQTFGKTCIFRSQNRRTWHAKRRTGRWTGIDPSQERLWRDGQCFWIGWNDDAASAGDVPIEVPNIEVLILKRRVQLVSQTVFKRQLRTKLKTVLCVKVIVICNAFHVYIDHCDGCRGRHP